MTKGIKGFQVGNTVGVKHGATRTPEYRCWNDMKGRCMRATHKFYPYYGGRGITVCEAWKTDFAAFLRDVGLRPTTKHTIDRIDNDGNYEPGNVRWATRKEQVDNRRSTRYVTVNGVRLPISQAAPLLGMTWKLLSSRLERGWSEERSISTPKLTRQESGTLSAASRRAARG